MKTCPHSSRVYLACGLVAMVLLALTGGPGKSVADDNGDNAARAIIKRAIAAHGGAARMKALAIRRISTRGILFGTKGNIIYDADGWESLPFCIKSVGRLKFGDLRETETRVGNRDKAWRKFDNAPAILMPKDLEAQQRAGLYTRYFMTLVPLLNDKSIALNLIGDSMIGKRPVLGVRIISNVKDADKVDLFFDKETGLMARSLSTSSDPASKEPALDEYLYDYKDFNGLKYPTLSIAYAGGKKHAERRVIELELLKMIPKTYFEEP